MYLKTTQSLWQQVEKKIDEMYDERLKYAYDWTHYGLTKPQFDALCLRSFISEEEDRMVQALGDKWFHHANNIEVRIANDTYALPTNTGGRKTYVSAHWGLYSDQPKIDNEKILAIAAQRREAVRKITAERDEFKKKVKDLWEQAPSVNALFKIWAPIADLLPPEALKKIEEKNTRRTTKEIAEGIDTQSLSVHILKAKVAR